MSRNPDFAQVKLLCNECGLNMQTMIPAIEDIKRESEGVKRHALHVFQLKIMYQSYYHKKLWIEKVIWPQTRQTQIAVSELQSINVKTSFIVQGY